MNITRLEPVYKDYIWGGNKLNEFYGKNSGLSVTAESWELSCHKDGMCRIIDGDYAGRTLLDAITDDPAALGEKAARFEFFPILIKFIDALSDLSVQVHPSDEYALKNEGQYGKTEMWYVVEAEEDAKLVYGLNKEVSREEFAELAKGPELMNVLNFVPVKKGDVFFIQSGVIHAIGKGLLICEIQQNSNLTYRVYDYDRTDAQGNKRPLHVEKAIAVSKLGTEPLKTSGELVLKNDTVTVENLATCEYFVVDKIVLDGTYSIVPDGSFISVTVVDGCGKIGGLEVSKGTTVFIPANAGSALLEGNMTVLSSYVK
ncbi:MAG: class I mannose-6-phosphate isomerase [Clostridia bacterium]|nr:class I mannose-6-phosphate isomerase [Clostridia bacterium]